MDKTMVTSRRAFLAATAAVAGGLVYLVSREDPWAFLESKGHSQLANVNRIIANYAPTGPVSTPADYQEVIARLRPVIEEKVLRHRQMGVPFENPDANPTKQTFVVPFDDADSFVKYAERAREFLEEKLAVDLSALVYIPIDKRTDHTKAWDNHVFVGHSMYDVNVVQVRDNNGNRFDVSDPRVSYVEGSMHFPHTTRSLDLNGQWIVLSAAGGVALNAAISELVHYLTAKTTNPYNKRAGGKDRRVQQIDEAVAEEIGLRYGEELSRKLDIPVPGNHFDKIRKGLIAKGGVYGRLIEMHRFANEHPLEEGFYEHMEDPLAFGRRLEQFRDKTN